MVEINIEYLGDFRCRLIHGPSGVEFVTDAPKDNQGRGESFSPTDLMAAALGSCMATVMGIVARHHGTDIKGMKVQVTKEMIQGPERRIGKLIVTMYFPRNYSEKERAMLERAALTCPVHRSLHPDVEAPVHFIYPS